MDDGDVTTLDPTQANDQDLMSNAEDSLDQSTLVDPLDASASQETTDDGTPPGKDGVASSGGSPVSASSGGAGGDPGSPGSKKTTTDAPTSSGGVDENSTELESKVETAETPTGEKNTDEPKGADGPDSLLGASPSIGLYEDWGAGADNACYVTVAPLSPAPTQGAVNTISGTADPSVATATLDANASFYTLEQRQAIAGDAFNRGLKGGLGSAAAGFAIDAAGLGFAVGGQRLIQMGTTGGKIAGGAMGTTVPVLGGVLAGINLYNTFKSADTKFVAPWNTMMDGDASFYERLAGGLEVFASVLGVVADVLGIASAILAIAGIISAIVGVGFALGGLAAQLAVAGLGVTIAAAAVSGIAAFVRYLNILESDGNPKEVQADADKLAEHVTNTVGQLGGLASGAVSNRAETKLQIKEVGADIDTKASGDLIDQALGATPSPGMDASPGKIAPSDIGNIPKQDLDMPVTVNDPGDPHIDIEIPNPIEVDVGSVPSLDPSKATGGQKLQEADFEGLTLGKEDYELYSQAYETPADKRTQSDVETLQVVDLYNQDKNPIDPKMSDVEVLQSKFSETELTRLQELQDADPSTWTPNDKYLMGKRAMMLDSKVEPGVTPVSKVVNEGDDGTGIKGFVALGETGTNKTGADLVNERGLNYVDGDGNTPYLKNDGTPVDDVRVVEAPLSQEMFDSRKIPIKPELEATMVDLGLPYRIDDSSAPFTGTGAAGNAQNSTLSNEYTVWNPNKDSGKFTVEPTLSVHGPEGRKGNATETNLPPTTDLPPKTDLPATTDLPAKNDLPTKSEPSTATASTSTTETSPTMRLRMANGIAQTSGVLQEATLSKANYEDPEATTPQPLGEDPMSWLLKGLPPAASLATSSAAVTTPSYNAASHLSSHPPSGQTVGLEPIPSLPHDPATVAQHLALAGVAAGRVQLLNEQMSMVDAMTKRADDTLTESGPYKVVEDVQDTRRKRIEENKAHADGVRATLEDAKSRKAAADKEKKKADDGAKKPNSGPVDGLMKLTGNSAVRGLVTVGGGIAKAGASIVNGIGSLLGADEPVIDTKVIDDLNRLFSVGANASKKNKEVQSKKGGTGDAINNVDDKIKTNTTELQRADAERDTLVGETEKIDGEIAKEKDLQRDHVAELTAELGAILAQRDLAMAASETASNVANAELTALANHRMATESVVANNQARISEARAAATEGALTGAEQSQVDVRKQRVATLRGLAEQSVSQANAHIQTSRMNAFVVNGFELPAEHTALAQAEVAKLTAVVQTQIMPLVGQMSNDLNVVTRDRVSATLAAVDAGLASCQQTLAEAKDRAFLNITAFFCIVKRPD